MLPSSGPRREALREKGQFWTPPWLANAMAAWVISRRPHTLFDPAVGPGTFFAAAREMGFTGAFAGFELDNSVLAGAYKLGLSPLDVAGVQITDFIQNHVDGQYPGGHLKSALYSPPPPKRRTKARTPSTGNTLSRLCAGWQSWPARVFPPEMSGASCAGWQACFSASCGRLRGGQLHGVLDKTCAAVPH